MINILSKFLSKFIQNHFISSLITIISNAALSILDISFISIFYYFTQNNIPVNYAYLFTIFISTYLVLNMIQYVFKERLQINLKNHLFKSLWTNIHQNESDSWILGRIQQFRLNFVNQSMEICGIFAIYIKNIIPTFLILAALSVVGILLQYYQNTILFIAVLIITYFTKPNNTHREFDESTNAILHEIRNMCAARFWNYRNTQNIYEFKTHLSINKYIPFILIFAAYSYFSITKFQSFLCIINLIINLKISTSFIYNMIKIRSSLNTLSDMTKYLIGVVNERKEYSLTFLTIGGTIAIENLTYFNGNYCALNNVSININNGEIVAVTGNYGKTVFLNIIAGLLWNYKGSVFINNVNISYVSPDAISANVAYIIPTDQLFLNMSIKDNILLNSNYDNIEFILQFVELQNLNILFPDGINTIISIDTYVPREIINKICIARAIARLHNAGILIIDNPSAINARLCEKLLKNSQLVKDKTIIISDKGSDFIDLANKVLFIDNSGNAYYNTKDGMPGEYYKLIHSSLYS
jgi:ABC-type multidrug transport system fused ATPase/permease subunit